jgi:hypothetical protein
LNCSQQIGRELFGIEVMSTVEHVIHVATVVPDAAVLSSQSMNVGMRVQKQSTVVTSFTEIPDY